jgi:hypothetical protein
VWSGARFALASQWESICVGGIFTTPVAFGGSGDLSIPIDRLLVRRAGFGLKLFVKIASYWLS